MHTVSWKEDVKIKIFPQDRKKKEKSLWQMKIFRCSKILPLLSDPKATIEECHKKIEISPPSFLKNWRRLGRSQWPEWTIPSDLLSIWGGESA